jgi:hypothetical protein
MADFCLQCSRDVLGVTDQNDMSGLSTPDDTAKGLYAGVLCEGCGPTFVDHEGRCVADCYEQHGLTSASPVRPPAAD